MPIAKPVGPSQATCPVIDSPCATLPSFAPGQKVAFCSLCQKNVHNFSALAEPERRSLLRSSRELCVRYALILPALVLGATTLAMAQDSADDEQQLDSVTVIGGRVAPTETVFRDSEIDESFDEESVQDEPNR